MQEHRNNENPPKIAVQTVKFLVPAVLKHLLDELCPNHASARKENQQNAGNIGNAKNESVF